MKKTKALLPILSASAVIKLRTAQALGFILPVTLKAILEKADPKEIKIPIDEKAWNETFDELTKTKEMKK